MAGACVSVCSSRDIDNHLAILKKRLEDTPPIIVVEITRSDHNFDLLVHCSFSIEGDVAHISQVISEEALQNNLGIICNDVYDLLVGLMGRYFDEYYDKQIDLPDTG